MRGPQRRSATMPLIAARMALAWILKLCERDELLDVRARINALGFVLTPGAQQETLQLVDSNPAMVKYRAAMLAGTASHAPSLRERRTIS